MLDEMTLALLGEKDAKECIITENDDHLRDSTKMGKFQR